MLYQGSQPGAPLLLSVILGITELQKRETTRKVLNFHLVLYLVILNCSQSRKIKLVFQINTLELLYSTHAFLKIKILLIC